MLINNCWWRMVQVFKPSIISPGWSNKSSIFIIFFFARNASAIRLCPSPFHFRFLWTERTEVRSNSRRQWRFRANRFKGNLKQSNNVFFFVFCFLYFAKKGHEAEIAFSLPYIFNSHFSKTLEACGKKVPSRHWPTHAIKVSSSGKGCVGWSVRFWIV